MRPARKLLVLVSVLGAVASCTDASAPSSERRATRVAITNFGSVKILDSSGVTLVVISCGVGCRARNVEWSEDGELLAITGKLDSASALFVARADGSEIRELARIPATIIPGPKGSTMLEFSDFQQAWSSDGRLTYVNNGLVVSAADGTGKQTLLPGASILRPRWGPRDSAITYINGATFQLDIMRPDGSNPRRLLTLPRNVTGQVWSPNGSMLAISTNTDAEGSLYVLDSRCLILREIGGVPYVSSYCWSPDSGALAFIHAETVPLSNNQIATASVVRPDGFDLTHLTLTPGYLSSRVSWSSDGKAVFLLSRDPQLQEESLFFVPIPPTAPRRFTTETGISYFSIDGIRCSYMFNL
jgi:WD40 repeat protein